MKDAVFAVIGDCVAGHTGLNSALSELRDAFYKVMAGRKREREKVADWRNSVKGAIANKVASHGEPSDDDPCAELAGLPTSGDEIRAQREGDFWDAREMLSLIWDWAKARRVAPDALLTEFLSGVVCHVPPTLLLPGIIGGRGTLSALFALSGPSGAGKGSAARAAKDAIQWERSPGLSYVRFPLGTGEGITKKFGFKHYDKGSDRHELVRTAHCAIIDIKDIDTLASLQQRGGSITITELTKFYSGEELGASYSDPKHVTIPEYTYHGCLIAGVQPARSGIIIDSWDSGFPQRWAWFEAVDKHMPDERPDEPERIDWSLPEAICDLGPDDDPFEFDVCGEVWRIIDKGRVEDQRAGKDDGHQRFTQEKIAAQLALLDGRVDLSKEDWDLAGFVMRKSARLETEAREALASSAAKINRERGRSEGIRRAVADDTADRYDQARVRGNILKHAADWIGEANLINGRIAKRDRDQARGLLADLVKSGELESRTVKGTGQSGVQYRTAP